MIEASFDLTHDKSTLLLTVKGHSGADEIGKDIVCASASILAYTLAQDVKDMFEHKQLRKKPTITMDRGYSVITCKPKKEFYAEALHSFFVIEKGFALLSHNYSDYVRLYMFGRDVEVLNNK